MRAEPLLADEALPDRLLLHADLAVQLELPAGGRVARRRLATGPRAKAAEKVSCSFSYLVMLYGVTICSDYVTMSDQFCLIRNLDKQCEHPNQSERNLVHEQNDHSVSLYM